MKNGVLKVEMININELVKYENNTYQDYMILNKGGKCRE